MKGKVCTMSDLDPARDGEPKLLLDTDEQVKEALATHGPEVVFNQLKDSALNELKATGGGENEAKAEAHVIDQLHTVGWQLLVDEDKFDDDDPQSAKQPGTECLIWAAQQHPDLKWAIAAGSEGSRCSRESDSEFRAHSRNIGHNLLCVAVEHLRASIEKGDFDKIALTETIESVAAYIDEADFPELYQFFITEFAPIILDITTTEAQSFASGDITKVYHAHYSNLLLERVADPFLELPEAYRAAAKAQMGLGSRASIKHEEHDYALVKSIQSGKSDGLAELLSQTGERTLGPQVWSTLEVMLANDQQRDAGLAAFSAIYQGLPDYFSRHTDGHFHGIEDMIYGQKFGEVVGLAGHMNAIGDLTTLRSKPDHMLSTFGGILTGLGMTDNYDGLELLRTNLTPRFSEELRAEIDTAFEDGQKKARTSR